MDRCGTSTGDYGDREKSRVFAQYVVSINGTRLACVGSKTYKKRRTSR